MPALLRAAPVAAVLAVVGCSGAGGSSLPTTTAPAILTSSTAGRPPTSVPASSASSTSPTTAAPAVTTAPTTDSAVDLDAQVEWFVDVLNGADPTTAEYEGRLAPVFRADVPYDAFVGLLPQIRAGAADWSVIDIEERDDLSGSFVLAPPAGGERLRLLMAIDADGRIETLFVQPADPPVLDDPPASFDEAVEELDELGRVGALSAEIVDGVCTAIDERGADDVLPIGSVFKLYVLGAVADAIAAGELDWEDELTVTDDVRSLPSGITQDEPTGTALSVLELTGRMIAISDNTATDLLIDAVGRDAVEQIQAEMGHADPTLNEPFLTTREVFIIKTDDMLLERFAGADPGARRAIVDEIADRPLPDLAPGDFAGDPIAPDAVEWFATPADLCRALAHLAEISTQPGLAEIAAVMSEQPGIPAAGFDEVWFKGGSEPGVLAAAWLVRREGRTFAVTASVVDPEVAFDQQFALLTMAELRGFLP